MKNIIKKSLILFCLSLTPLLTYGQNNISTTIEIDSLTDSKITALIFAEHQKLSVENSLLKEEIASLNELNSLFKKTDSIQNIEIDELTNRVNSDAIKIKKLESSRKNIIKGSCVGGIVLFILGLLL